jgi:hypothetical protein
MYAKVNQSDRDNLDFDCHSLQEFSSCFLSAQIRYYKGRVEIAFGQGKIPPKEEKKLDRK